MFFGKKKINYKKVEEEEIPERHYTFECWNNLYTSNTDLELNEGLLKLLNKYENRTTHVDEDRTEEEIKQAIRRRPNWKALDLT